MLKDGHRYKKAARVSEYPGEDGQLALYHPDYAERIVLNETAALIWKNVCEGKKVRDIINMLAQQYDMDKRTATRDTQETIKRFLILELLDVDATEEE